MEKVIKKVFIVRNTNLGGINTIVKNFYDNASNVRILSLSKKEKESYIDYDDIIYFPLLNRKRNILIRILNKIFPYLFVRLFCTSNTEKLIEIIESEVGKNFKAYACGYGAYSNINFKIDKRLILVSHSVNSEMLNIRCPKYLYKINISILKKIIPKRFIAVSDTIKNDWKKILDNDYEIKVIKNPFKLKNNFNNVVEKKENYFVFCGRLSYEKNIINIINYFISSELGETKLLIIGDGPDKKRITSYINDKGISNLIIFKGYIENPYDVISKAKCLILNSHYEGYPTVVIESLLLGTKVVLGQCGGAAYDIIQPKYHHNIINKSDKSKFIETFNRVLNDNYPLFEIDMDDISISKAINKYEQF